MYASFSITPTLAARLPARYFDPITRLPYANLQAIKVLREAYYQQLELKGNRNVPEVSGMINEVTSVAGPGLPSEILGFRMLFYL